MPGNSKYYTEREMEILKAKIKIADSIESIIKGNDFELRDALAPNVGSRIQRYEDVKRGLKLVLRFDITESDE